MDSAAVSLSVLAFRRFRSDWSGRLGVIGVSLLLFPALYAPLLANGRPFLMWGDGTWSMPFLHSVWAPDSTEFLIEQIFNYFALLLPPGVVSGMLLRRRPGIRRGVWTALALLLLLPFGIARGRLDKTDYRKLAEKSGIRAVFAPIPYGPFEPVAAPGEKPNARHWLGTDEVGRDVASRLIYGARVSLAVGILATAISLALGTAVGLLAGFYRNWVDLAVMRAVEILLCFPTFLLLLILMSILSDRKFEQSILIVIGVIGFTGWIGVTFLVRGETLKLRERAFIQSCEVIGIPAHKIMFGHLLPNISGPILICFTFGVAGAILAESSLSFLGFGVQPPTASWGGLLRQAFDNPLEYWHLTLFPGVALFIAVMSFNFLGEGIRRALDLRRL